MVALERVGTKNTCAVWKCICDCKNYKEATVRDLRSGNTQSCGCLKNERLLNYNHSKRNVNTYDLSGGYGIGYTSKGEEFYFDLEDYDKIKDYCWDINHEGYVICNSNQIYIQNIIMDTNNDDDFSVDHIHHKTYDNRKSELRIVTHSNNCMNRSFNQYTKSGITGVTWCDDMSKWRVRIGVNNKRITLGYYSNIDEAAKVRKQAEDKYFGEYSYDNSMNMEDNIEKK